MDNTEQEELIESLRRALIAGRKAWGDRDPLILEIAERLHGLREVQKELDQEPTDGELLEIESGEQARREGLDSVL